MTVFGRTLSSVRRNCQQVLMWPSRLIGIDPQLLLHSSFLLAATVLGQVLSFGVQMLVARRIGTGGYGIYSYAFAWVSLAALLALMGRDRLALRYASQYRVNAAYALLHSLVRWCYGWSLAGSVILMSVFVLAGLTLLPTDPEWLGVTLWSALAVPLVVGVHLTESLLRALEAHGWASTASRVLRPLLMGGLFLLLPVFLTSQPDARWAAAANTLALLAVLVISVAALRLRLPPRPPQRIDQPSRAWLGTSVAFGVNALALFLNGQLGILVLGAFQDEEVVGIYGSVLRLAALMHFAGVSVLAIVQPMIVRSAATASRDDTQRLVRGGARLILLTNLCFALPIALFAEPLLAMFGPGFEAGATPLRVLALGALAASMISPAGALLGMMGYEKQATMVMVGGCCLTLVLSVLLTPRFGATGAALATAASSLTWNLGLFALAQAKLGVTAAPLSLPRGRWIRT